MLHLILDCSGPHVQWVLAKNETVLDSIESKHTFDAAEHALSLLETLLKKHSILLKDIMYYAYIEGPGSFTGLRIAAATLKALSFSQEHTQIIALNPCYLLVSQYISHFNPDQNSALIPIIASRKNHIYHCTYIHKESQWILEKDIKEQAIDTLNFNYKKPIFIGPDSTLINQEDFYKQSSLEAISAQTMAKASYTNIKQQNFQNKASFSPNYVVQSVAKPKSNR